MKKASCPRCCCCTDCPGIAIFDLAVNPADDGAFVWKCRNCGELVPAVGIDPVPFNTDEPVTVGQVEALLLDNNGRIQEDN